MQSMRFGVWFLVAATCAATRGSLAHADARAARVAGGDVAGRVAAQAPAPTAEEVDAHARRAFLALKDDERREVVDWISSTIAGLKCFRANLVARSVSQSDISELDAPAPAAPSWFDPKLHAPAQPIPRKLVPAGDPRNEALRKRFRLGAGRSWTPAARYDWGAGRIVKERVQDEPRRVFENALRGRAPREDWVEALVEARLDDGSQRKALAAFEHLYTDRAGNAFEGISLHDAWKSGADIEMPDVDVLGIVHAIKGDWTTWTAPVPERQHARLYETVGGWFAQAKAHRVLRIVLARSFLEADEPLPDGYAHLAPNFHCLWDEHESDPGRLLAALPSFDGQKAWIEALAARVRADPKAWERGEARRQALRRDAAEVRGVVLWVLREYGAYERSEAPK
jgi:hypothetical protein